MKIVDRNTKEVLATILTNQNMTIYQAVELAGLDAGHDEENEYDIDELEMDYDS
jgi:hypothetical protein